MQYSIQKRTVVGGGANKTTFEMTINGYGHRDAIINATLLVLRGYDPKGDQKGCYVVQMANTPCMAFRITSPQKLAGVVGTGDLDNRLDDAGALKQYENLKALGDRLRDEIDAVLPIVTWATGELNRQFALLASQEKLINGILSASTRTDELIAGHKIQITELQDAVRELTGWQAAVDLVLRAMKRAADEPKIPWYRRLGRSIPHERPTLDGDSPTCRKVGGPKGANPPPVAKTLADAINRITELEAENEELNNRLGGYEPERYED